MNKTMNFSTIPEVIIKKKVILAQYYNFSIELIKKKRSYYHPVITSPDHY